MPVKIYVSKDSSGNEWGPDFAHEMESMLDLLKRIWAAYYHLPAVYAMIANLRKPASADLVIVTERGLGVIDLKHYSGLIHIDPDGRWYADRSLVKGGVNHPTPHRQVQFYAESIRKQTLRGLLPKALLSDPARWDSFKFQTAICFTNPLADLKEIKLQAKQHPSIHTAPWENFSVIEPGEIVEWVASLRFETNYGRERDFDPYRLKVQQIYNLVVQAFGGVEWTEVLSSMPSGEPYGYLYRLDDENEPPYPLIKDDETLGRSDECDIIAPSKFARVSRQHCRIVRRLHALELHDLDSLHGTYLAGELVDEVAELKHDQVITLGGPAFNEKTWALRFKSRGQTSHNLPSTEPSKVN